MFLLLPCRRVAHLLLERENRPLLVRERVQLRMHMSICTACTRFDGQVRLMREAMGKWKNYGDD